MYKKKKKKNHLSILVKMQIQNEQVLNKAYHDVFLKKKKILLLMLLVH